jgi:hypothetical protein
MPFSGVLHHVTLVRTDDFEECSASIIRVTRISDLGMLAVTSNRACCKETLCENGSVTMEYQIEDGESSRG